MSKRVPTAWLVISIWGLLAVAGLSIIVGVGLVHSAGAEQGPQSVVITLALSQAPTQTQAGTAVAFLKLDLNPTSAPTDTVTPTLTSTITPSVTPTFTASATVTSSPTLKPTKTATPIPTNTPTVAPTETQQPHPAGLPDSSYLPVVSDKARQIYQYGLSIGNNPRGFTRLGDCHSAAPDFLGTFDTPGSYQLGSYGYLQAVINEYAGSFGRAGYAAHRGFHLGSYFSALWADPEACHGGENPMECEYRLYHPSVIFVNAGTLNMASPDGDYESLMRRIIEFWISKGVVPILNTKADDLEGYNRFNTLTRHLAAEYDIPLWDYYVVAQTLPNGGMGGDNVHLSVGGNNFDDPAQMQTGWTLRNLTGLQALESVWLGLQK